MQIKIKPYTKLLRKIRNLHRQKIVKKSFDALKQALISAPILAYPTREDFFILDTDASNVGMGSVLSQFKTGKKKLSVITANLLAKQRGNIVLQEGNFLQ